MSVEQIDPAHLPTYIKEAAHRLRQRFDQVETVAKSELQLMLAGLSGLVAQMPDEVLPKQFAGVLPVGMTTLSVSDTKGEPLVEAEPEPEDGRDPDDDRCWW